MVVLEEVEYCKDVGKGKGKFQEEEVVEGEDVDV